MLDEQFLKILRDKLAKGSTASALLNCIPGTNLYKIDAFDLNIVHEGLANEFVGKLLSEENFTFPISYQNIPERDLTDERKIELERLSKKLNRVYNDNELSFQEKGHRTFGFGYPVFVMEIEDSWVLSKVGAKKKEKRLIAAPLFIWPMEIHKSFKQSRTWHIKKTPDSVPILNDAFVSFVKQKHEVDLYKIIELGSDELLSYSKLETMTAKILSAINRYERETLDIFSPEQIVVPLREKKELQEKATTNGFIEWSGVFTLYSKQKQNLINELDQMVTKKNEFTLEDADSSGESPFKHSFTSLDTDHSQQNVINQLRSGTHFVIQGPPGTGKSQTLTALITNALSNGTKCLVVCEKNTALEVIFNNLKSIGLEHLCAIINDPTSKDRQIVVEKVRAAPLLNYPAISDIRFNNEVDDLTDKLAELSKGYAVLTQLIWEDQAWADMLGRFLKVKKVFPNNPFKEKLKQIEWELSPNEYKTFRKVLVMAQSLRQKDVSSFAERLNKKLFDDDRKGLTKDEVQDKVEKNLNNFERVRLSLSQLPEKCLGEAETYYKKIFKEVEVCLTEFSENYSQLQRLSPDLVNILPASFNDYLSKFNALFSSKTKRANQYRRKILELYQLILQLNQDKKLLTFQFLNDSEYLQLSLLEESIGKYRDGFKEFKSKVGELISELMETALIKVTPSDEIKLNDWLKIQKEFEEAIKKLNESGLFEKTFTFEHKNNYYQQQEFLSEVISHLKNVQDNLKNFSAFFDYQKFYLSLNQREQNVLDIFITDHQPNDKKFEDLFDRFYLEQILLHNQNKDIINDGKKLELIYQKITELKKLVGQKVISRFSEKQRSSIRAFPSFKSLYNLRGSGGQRRNSLRQIVNHNFDFFTNFFPVILTNPTACSMLFPLKQNLFDVVIFDEASQLRLEDTLGSLLRGKTKIVSGDHHQMPPPRQYELTNTSDEEDEPEETEENQESIVNSNITKSLANSESLLDYVTTIGYKKTHLLVHYRSNHSALINFSNNAFYSGNLLPIIKKEDYIPIKFYRVDGLYTQRTNPAEADKAIEILTSLVDLKKGICPSVGIATFNIFQRDLIYDKINQRSSIDSEFSEKMAQLYAKGFFVKNLENIQGDERDVIIMTTTFGKDEEGRFYKRFGPLGNKNGYRLLNVIITRAKNQFYICTSIPDAAIQGYEEMLKRSGKNDGIPIVFAYLAYAKAVSEDNQPQIEHILDVVKHGSTEEIISVPRLVETESPFEEEVYDEMLRIVRDSARIKSQVWIGSFRVDFLIEPIDDNRKPLVIECDGASYHGTSEAYAYDYFRMQQLKENGYEVYRIWSANWFDDQEFLEEVKHLTMILGEYDATLSNGSRFKKQEENLTILGKIELLITSEVDDEIVIENEVNQVSGEDEDVVLGVPAKSENSEVELDNVDKSVSNDLQEEFNKASNDKNLWFSIAHWGKTSGKLSSFENRFCFSLGIYQAKHDALTEKQKVAGYKLYYQARKKGFSLEEIGKRP